MFQYVMRAHPPCQGHWSLIPREGRDRMSRGQGKAEYKRSDSGAAASYGRMGMNVLILSHIISIFEGLYHLTMTKIIPQSNPSGCRCLHIQKPGTDSFYGITNGKMLGVNIPSHVRENEIGN